MKPSYFKQMLNGDKNYRVAFVLAVAVPILCAAAAVLIVWANGSGVLRFFVCPIRRLTGFQCLSCGATHATLALLRGDVKAAIRYNPLYVAFLGYSLYLYARVTASLFARPYRPFVLRPGWKTVAVIVILLIAFTVLRNRTAPF